MIHYRFVRQTAAPQTGRRGRQPNGRGGVPGDPHRGQVQVRGATTGRRRRIRSRDQLLLRAGPRGRHVLERVRVRAGPRLVRRAPAVRRVRVLAVRDARQVAARRSRRRARVVRLRPEVGGRRRVRRPLPVARRRLLLQIVLICPCPTSPPILSLPAVSIVESPNVSRTSPSVFLDLFTSTKEKTIQRISGLLRDRYVFFFFFFISYSNRRFNECIRILLKKYTQNR